jgi:hypothetical protein
MRVLACLALMTTLAACGSSATAPTPPAVAGHWQGSITSPSDGVGTITLDLAQTGAEVTGTVLLSQPGLPDAPGTLTGTLTTSPSASLRYTAFYDYGDGCTGTYNGSLDVTDGQLSGTYIGQNCAHTFTGSLNVTRKTQTP